jgi:chromosomal replication initiation ATPase DnaA
MEQIGKTKKQVGYMLFPGLGHTTYLTKEEVKQLRKFSDSVLLLMVSESICEIMEVTKEQLFSLSRKQPAPLARQICMYSLNMDMAISLKGVGKLMRPIGKPYNHSTVSYAKEMISDYLDPSDGTPFAKGIKQIYSKLNLKLKRYINEGNSPNRRRGER